MNSFHKNYTMNGAEWYNDDLPVYRRPDQLPFNFQRGHSLFASHHRQPLLPTYHSRAPYSLDSVYYHSSSDSSRHDSRNLLNNSVMRSTPHTYTQIFYGSSDSYATSPTRESNYPAPARTHREERRANSSRHAPLPPPTTAIDPSILASSAVSSARHYPHNSNDGPGHLPISNSKRNKLRRTRRAIAKQIRLLNEQMAELQDLPSTSKSSTASNSRRTSGNRAPRQSRYSGNRSSKRRQRRSNTESGRQRFAAPPPARFEATEPESFYSFDNGGYNIDFHYY